MASTAHIAAGKDEWPSYSEELSRKTSEQLALWIDRFDRGVINLVTIISIVSTLYDTTSGLIEMDLSNVLADVHKDLMWQAQQKS